MEERWDFSTAVENGYVLEHSSGEHVPNNFDLLFASYLYMKSLVI
jgi:hypothetical protein